MNVCCFQQTLNAKCTTQSHIRKTMATFLLGGIKKNVILFYENYPGQAFEIPDFWQTHIQLGPTNVQVICMNIA